MVNILIIDDDIIRTREISSVVSLDGVNVEYVTTTNEAMRSMGAKTYDLVILDIILPSDLKTVGLTKDAGIELLNQIELVGRINKPYNIIAVTSSTDVYAKHKAFFEARLIPFLEWTSLSDSWKEPLKNKVQYLINIDKQRPKNQHVDIAIITAVQEEYEAALALFDGWTRLRLPDDPTIYQTATIICGEDSKNLLLTMLPEMGMTASSCLTTKIIKSFSPSQIYMLGICGGVKGDVNLDDLVVSSISWDYGSGKIMPRDDGDGTRTYYIHNASPNQIDISASINSEITAYGDEFIKEIQEEWNRTHEDKHIAPKIHIAPMPSGAAVVCDNGLFSEIIKPQHIKSKALDMETYGVYFAIKNSTTKNIEFFSAKAVSDFADNEKNDDHHKSCCFISANFVKKFIMKHNSEE